MWSVLIGVARRLFALLKLFGGPGTAVGDRGPDHWQIAEPFEDLAFVHITWPEGDPPAPEVAAMGGPVKSRSGVLVARLRYVAGLKRRSSRSGWIRPSAQAARARRLIGAKKPRPLKTAAKAQKRAPELFAVKRKMQGRKRPATLIMTAKRAQPTAVILKFQLRAPVANHRIKRAA